MKVHTVAHISHTDISCDARILREMRSISEVANVRVVGIGIAANSDTSSSNDQPFVIHATAPSRIGRILPRSLALALNLAKLYALSIWKCIRLRPTVVHCHDTPALPAGALIRLATGCKVIYDAHELESEKQTSSIIYPKITYFIEKICWPSVDHFITVSNGILDWYRSHFSCRPSSIVMNAPIVDSEQIPESGSRKSNYFREMYGIPAQSVIFLYLGILGPGRGIEVFLDALIEDTNNTHAVFMGSGPLEQHLRERSESCQRVHLHPPVPHQKVVEISASADVGLCLIDSKSLSDYYCLPNKLFEYSFAGLTVLASSLPEIEYVVERHKLGRCCKPEKEALTAEIDLIAKSRPAFEGIDLYDLSWARQADTLCCLYEKFLA